jgi:hypothetical protein
MVTVANQKARHGIARLSGAVEVGGNDQTGAALKDQVFNSKTISMKGARNERFWRFSFRWELAQGVTQRLKTPITKLLPIG